MKLWTNPPTPSQHQNKLNMTKEITITVTAPVECTDAEFNEWVMYNTGYTASISLSNPLCDEPFEAETIDID